MNKGKQLTLPMALLIGFYTLFFLGGITRELMARFGGSLEAITCGFLFLILWTVVGCIGLSKRQYSIVVSICSVATLPLTAIIGIITIAMLPNAGTPAGIGTVILTAGAGTFLFGINSGIAYTLNNKEDDNYIGWIIGAIAGGVSYQFCNKIPMPETLLLLGSAILLCGVVFIKTFSLKLRVVFAYLSILSLLMLGWLWQQQEALRYRVEAGNKIKSFEHADGRYSVIVENNRQQGEFLLYRNGLCLWDIPNDCGNYSAAVLFSAIQHKSNDQQRVLIISSPFTNVPSLMLSLPNISSVDLLYDNRNLASLSTYCGILPPSSPRFKLVINQQRFFLPNWGSFQSGYKYDLIVVLDDTPDLPLTQHFFSQLKNILNPSGVITIGIQHQRHQTKKLVQNLRTVFREVKMMDANPVLIAAGDGDITVSPDELDARFSANANIPTGTLSALYSTFKNIATKNTPAALSKPDIFILPPLLWNGYLTAVIACALYLIIRFILSRRHNNAVIFAAGENGFYTIVFIIMASLYFQTLTGHLYSRGVLPIATIMSGIAVGVLFFSRGSTTVTVITVLSVILPSSLLLLKLPFIEQWPIEIIITPILLCTGIATGCCHIMLRHKTTIIADNKLPIFEFVGGIIAVILTLFHSLFEPNIISIVLILIAIRLTTAISIIKIDKFARKV